MKKAFTCINYYGGKQKLAKDICAVINSVPYDKYVEPFAGGASVYWRLVLQHTKPNVTFVLNDFNKQIYNFYKTLKDKRTGKKLLDLIYQRCSYNERYFNTAQEIFYEKKKASSLERAWAVFYLGVSTYISSFDNNFMVPMRFTQVQHMFDRLHLRSKRVENCYYAPSFRRSFIYNQDAVSIMKKHDSENTIFYLDPPYVKSWQGHYEGYNQDDFDELLKCCEGLKGKFVLSHYKNPSLEEFMERNEWYLETFDVTSSSSCQANFGSRERKNVLESSKRSEWLVSNFIPHNKEVRLYV